MAIIWLDLETTGLDPDKDIVLEIAAVCTDDDLNQIGPAFECLTSDRLPPTIDQVVDEMHTANKLWIDRASAIASGTALSVVEAVRRLRLWACVVTGWIGKFPLGGNTPSFDRAFLMKAAKCLGLREQDWPLSHRHIDVSTLNELAKRWGTPAPKTDAHRAMADVRASIATLEHYRASGFINGNSKEK